MKENRMNTIRRIKHVLAGGLLAAAVLGATAGSAAAAADTKQKNANLTIMLHETAEQNGVLTYDLNVRNLGDGPAIVTHIAVPYDASALQVLSAEFDQDDAWVVASGAGGLAIQTGRIDSGGDTLHATLRFAALKNGAELTQPASISWRDDDDDGSATSNRPVEKAASYALGVQQDGRDIVFSSDIFVPNELVNFWYTTASGQSIEAEVKNGYLVDADTTDKDDQGADYLGANESGALSVRVDTRKLAKGSYTLTARGSSSGLIAVAGFEVR
jgi:hypothetical protein